MGISPEKLLLELIALPSVNPALLPAEDPRAGEKDVADFLAALAARAGLGVEMEEVFPGRANVIARLQPAGRIVQRILLAPHTDTVGVADNRQFKPAAKNGRIQGRGACDTKGSVAAMFSALLAVAQSPKRPKHTEIIFCGLVDEEVGQGGSRFLVRRRFKADLAIVGEPTCCQIVTAHKGDLWLKLETRGIAAHGATPHLGTNAIHAMAKIVHLLETNYAQRLRKRRHALLGPATINVGTSAGGRQPNSVPDQCSIQIDRRTIPGEIDARVKRDILQFLRSHGLDATMADTKGEAPARPMETDARSPLVARFLRTAGQRRPCGADFFTDAGVLSSGGIRSVVFGPGDIAQAHTVDEWVAVSQLRRATELIVRFLLSAEK